nr:MAG TPA: hypothetical protein [Caudoviricetes sp.]
MIEFTVLGKPFGKERPRPNRTGHGVYTPQKNEKIRVSSSTERKASI